MRNRNNWMHHMERMEPYIYNDELIVYRRSLDQFFTMWFRDQFI
jgi:hypothetical protein